MKLFEVTNTICMRKSANCKAQIRTMCGVNDTDLCIAICRFSHAGCVCHLEQLHAQSPFLFPIVFSINNFCVLKITKSCQGQHLCGNENNKKERESISKKPLRDAGFFLQGARVESSLSAFRFSTVAPLLVVSAAGISPNKSDAAERRGKCPDLSHTQSASPIELSAIVRRREHSSSFTSTRLSGAWWRKATKQIHPF